MKTVYFWFTFAPVSIICSVLVLIFWPFSFIFDRKKNSLHFIATLWGKTILILNPYWKIKVHNKEHLNSVSHSGSVVYVLNHRSQMDIMLLYSLGVRFCWLSKQSVFYIPFIGWAMCAIGYIPVKRNNKKSRQRCFYQSIEQIKNGISMAYFPEGTRIKENTLGKFQPGAFRLARDTHVPLVPITFVGSDSMMATGSLVVRPATVDIFIHPPVLPAEHTTEQLTTMCRTTMLETFHKFTAQKMARILVVISMGFGLSLGMVGCATYSGESQDVRRAFYGEEYTSALEKIDGSAVASRGRDRVLYRMERGMIQYVAQNYAAATKDWQLAGQFMDELYTTSLSQEAAGLAVGESMTDYVGEAHEKLLVPFFSALAFCSHNQTNEALVESRRIGEILARKDFSQYNQDFVRFLAGFIYESKGDWDSAIVEYRHVLESSNASPSVASLTSQSLYTVAKVRNRKDMMQLAQKFSKNMKSVGLQDGEILLVVELGKAPLKEPQDFFIPVNGTVVRISFPVYKSSWYNNREAFVEVGGNSVGQAPLLLDVGKQAKLSLEKRRAKDLVRMAVRLVAKQRATQAAGETLGILGLIGANIATAATESADTRSWTTLPDIIRAIRFSVPTGKDVSIQVRGEGGAFRQLRVKLNPGEKRLLRTRISF